MEGKLGPVRFVSRAFSDTESGWYAMQMELYGVKWVLGRFRPCILGERAKVVTGRANLEWHASVKPWRSKLARWCLSMSGFHFFIVHKLGREHVIPDALSRLPISSGGSQLIMLPPDVSNFLTTSLSLGMECESISNTRGHFSSHSLV